MTEHPHVLLATLGGQPQIITFTLDLLLARGFPIKEVVAIHPKMVQPRLQHSVTCLTDEFTGNYYKMQHPPIEAWNIDDHERLDYHFLHTKFANYFQTDE